LAEAGDQATTATLDPLRVCGDSAYGTGDLLDRLELETVGAESVCKVQPPTAAGARFTKDNFTIDLAAGTVTYPAGQTAPLRHAKPGQMAYFGPAFAACPLVERYTNSKGGRTVFVGPYEEQLARARARQRDPDFHALTTAPPAPKSNARPASDRSLPPSEPRSPEAAQRNSAAAGPYNRSMAGPC
jgi:hypothetical protein